MTRPQEPSPPRRDPPRARWVLAFAALAAAVVVAWYFGVYDTAAGKCSRGDVQACVVAGAQQAASIVGPAIASAEQQFQSDATGQPQATEQSNAPASALPCPAGYAHGCGPWSTLDPSQCAYGVDYEDYGDGHPGYGAVVISDADRASGACSDLQQYLIDHTSSSDWALVTRSGTWLDGSSLACQGRGSNTVGGSNLYQIYDVYETGGPGIEACSALGLGQ